MVFISKLFCSEVFFFLMLVVFFILLFVCEIVELLEVEFKFIEDLI